MWKCSFYCYFDCFHCRYCSIIHPLKRYIKRKHLRYIVIVIWLLSAVTLTPFIVANNVQKINDVCSCRDFGWNTNSLRVYTAFLMSFTYITPSILLIIINARLIHFQLNRRIPGDENWSKTRKRNMLRKIINQKKSVCLLISMVLVFMICHLPQNIINILWHFGNNLNWTAPISIGIISFHSKIILYLNSALNPILYCFIDRRFRRALHRLLIRWKDRCFSYQRNLPYGPERLNSELVLSLVPL